MRTDYSMWGGKPRQSLQILEMIAAHGDSDECLLWPYRCRKDGYGDVQHEKKRWRVTRLTWFLVYGSLDETLFILHSCDNPPCFNPKHLFQGTQDDNMKDMDRKGRRKTNGRPGILRGPSPHLAGENASQSKLTEDQVREIRLRHANGETYERIAADYGINASNASHIFHRRTWSHVE